jgi:hypothetical protein
VKTAKWSDAENRYRDGRRHAGQDSPVQEDPATRNFANID